MEIPRLTAILISRFLLHLQSANLRAIGGGSSSAFADTHESSIIFDRVVGSIGASIGTDDYFSRGTDIPEEGDLMDEHEDSSETKQEDSSETKQEE